MIDVQVKLFATLRRHFPKLGIGEAMTVALPDKSTVRQLLKEMNLPDDQIQVVFVNGTVQKREYPLNDGDEIGIFPPVGGG